MAEEFYNTTPGELLDDEPFWLNPADERASYPFVDGELMTEVQQLFAAYIFAKPSCEQRGQRVGWCSACGDFIGESGMVDAVQAANGGKLVGWHNADAKCPHCGRMATVKDDNRMRSYNSLRADGMVAYIYVAAADLVYIRMFDTAVRYGADEPQGEFYPVYKSEACRYRLRPGEWVCEKNGYRGFERSKIPLDLPINEGTLGFCGIERLARSFLRYHRVGDYYDSCGEKTAYSGYGYKDYKAYYPMKYLCRLAEYPQVEMAQKLGLHWAVNELVSDNRKNARLLDWTATTVSGFLRLDKPTAKAYLRESREKEVLVLLHRYKGAFTVAECKFLCGAGDRAAVLVAALQKYRLTPERLQNYIRKKSITCADWLDYISGAEALGYDLTVHNVLLPKDFHEAHDAAVRGLAVADFKKLSKKQQRALKRRAKKYEWRIGGYIFRFPLAAQEIVEEGKALGHCVGGYAGRHMDGKTNIVFLRHADRPDTSLYTIEIDGATVRQAYGRQNRIKPQDDPAVAPCYRLWQMRMAGDRHLRLCGSFENMTYKEKRICPKTAS